MGICRALTVRKDWMDGVVEKSHSKYRVWYEEAQSIKDIRIA